VSRAFSIAASPHPDPPPEGEGGSQKHSATLQGGGRGPAGAGAIRGAAQSLQHVDGQRAHSIRNKPVSASLSRKTQARGRRQRPSPSCRPIHSNDGKSQQQRK